MTLIVVFALSQPEHNREGLIQRIKASGKWARLTHNVYLVFPAVADPVALRDSLNTILVPGDRLYIGVAPPPSAWVGLPEDVSKWILANQR